MYSPKITRELDLLGMSNKIRGYKYSRAAIDILLRSGSSVRIDILYKFVSEQFGTSVSCVERNIRYAVEKTWEQGDIDRIYYVFGYTVRSDRGKPTNSEFLYMLTDRIRTFAE